MKIFITILFIFICPLMATAQLKMDIAQMTVINLKKGSNKRMITNGKDTTMYTIIHTGEFDSPRISAKVKIKNISDSIFMFHQDESTMYITFWFNNKLIKNKMSLIYNLDNGRVNYPENLILNPNQEISIISSGYLVKSSSSLKIALEFDSIADNTMNVLRILPTLKFHYKNENGVEITHSNVYDVRIEEHPAISDFILPDGYYIIQ